MPTAAPPQKSKFAAKLKTMNAKWATAREKAKNDPEYNQGRQTIDDGKYITRLMSSEVGTSQAGKLQIVTKFVVVKGDHAGATIPRYDGLEREEGLPWIFKFLESLGMDADQIELDKLEESLAAITAEQAFYRILVKTKGDFQNIYVDRKLEDYDPSDTDIADTGDGAGATESTEGEEAGAAAWNVGDKVNAPVDGVYYEAEVTAVNGDTITVKFSNDAEDNFASADLQAVSAEEQPEETAEPQVEVGVGSRVSFVYTDKKKYTGAIATMAPDGTWITVKPDKPLPGAKSPTFKIMNPLQSGVEVLP